MMQCLNAHIFSSEGIILVVQPPSERKECTKKVLATMTIQKLKGLIQRVFREGSPPTAITAVSTRVTLFVYRTSNY